MTQYGLDREGNGMGARRHPHHPRQDSWQPDEPTYPAERRAYGGRSRRVRRRRRLGFAGGPDARPLRRGPGRRGRHARPARVPKLAPVLLICGMAAIAVFLGVGAPGLRVSANTPQETVAVRTAELAPPTREVTVNRKASRALPRVSPSGSPRPKASPAPKRALAKEPPQVTGLSRTQSAHAKAIVDVGRERGLPQRAQIVAMATAMQESNLRNLANRGAPESVELPNDGVAADFDSVGVFQQRPSQGWGTVKQLMTPRYAASAFYGRLVKVPNWPSMSVTEAAQAVQKSGFPTAYAKHEARATQIVSELAP